VILKGGLWGENGEAFVTRKIPSVNGVVKELLPEGVTILAAKPKNGKSCFALDLSLAVASGQPFMGTYDVSPGCVLYLNYDDPSESGLQERVKALTGERSPHEFYLRNLWDEQAQPLRKLADGLL
jgi:hypothetical protein